MGKFFTMLAVVAVMGFNAAAAPGDTTKVQAHSDIWMDHYGNFDTTVEFPDGSTSYRMARMTFTLGRYACPGNPQYCGDWDYTVQAFLMTKNGDTVELGRLISPYAGDGWPRTSVTWKQRYEFDVTDFYTLLKDSATVRIHYSGYSWGFTGNIRFDFIEGTPPRSVVGVERLWKGSHAFGKALSINDRIASMNRTAPAGTQFTELGLTISGHGSDAAQCSEFCKKFYEVSLNSNKFDKTDIWRDDCGYNHMYPQNGTWIYNRGNWCPGDKVFVNMHKLAGITDGTNYDLDVEFENYVSASGDASYIFEGNVFYYGAFNRSVDASLDDIIAPSDHETHYRQNPMTGKPLVTVRNTGATTLTSIKFRYEMSNGTGAKEYTWQGNLASLQSTEVEFPPFYDLMRAGSSNTFTVEIIEVNGAADEDATNNKLTSNFKAALKTSTTVIVEMRTNKGTTNGISENSWKIIDQFNGFTYAERKNCAAETFYSDTVKLTVGMYKLVVEDAGCDGLSWWANPNAGAGYVYLKGPVSQLPMPLTGYFNGDFGCGFTQYFNVDWPASVTEVKATVPAINVFPNPAQTMLTVTLDGIDQTNGTLLLKDIAGRVVLSQKATGNSNNIDVSGMANGVYMLEYNGNTASDKLQTKVVVAR